jgi:hypothetical protein
MWRRTLQRCNEAIGHLNTRHSELGKKPKEYFERKRNELKVQQKLIRSPTTTSEAALKASYKLALCIAKDKKPFTIAEKLIMPCMKDVCFELLGVSKQYN